METDFRKMGSPKSHTLVFPKENELSEHPYVTGKTNLTSEPRDRLQGTLGGRGTSFYVY
jgi:hypothetical protein